MANERAMKGCLTAKKKRLSDTFEKENYRKTKFVLNKESKLLKRKAVGNHEGDSRLHEILNELRSKSRGWVLQNSS